MTIREVKNIKELENVFKLVLEVLPSVVDNSKYTLTFWKEQYMRNKPLLQVSEIEGAIVGFAWGFIDGQRVTLSHLGVKDSYQGQKIGTALLRRFEDVVKKLDYSTINLGAVHGKEPFYFRNGFQAMLLLQSETLTLQELSQNATNIISTHLYDDKVSQVFCQVTNEDYQHTLERYKGLEPTIHAIIMFSKELYKI